MALKREIEMAFGGKYPDAYHRITSVHFIRSNPPVLEVRIDTWISETARLTDHRPVEVRKHEFLLPEEQKEIGQVGDVYQLLKTLKDYEGAIDD